MRTQYIVKDVISNRYYTGVRQDEWDEEAYLSEAFKTEAEALDFIDTQDGLFTIIKVYRP